MKLLPTLLITASCFGILGGMVGGLISYKLLSSPSMPQLAVLNLKKLTHHEVAKLRHKPGSEEQLLALARKQGPQLQANIEQWASEHQIILLNKAALLSTLPDLTDEFMATYGERP